MLISPGTDYPDLIGVISPERLSLDVADVAFGIRSVSSVTTAPVQINAGQRFEAVLLVQNNADCEIDAEARLLVPVKDSKGAARRFATKADKRIAVGLIPGEVGYIRFPVMVDRQTAPDSQYPLQLEIEIKRKARSIARVRSGNGAAFKLADLPPQVRTLVTNLSAVSFTAAVGRQGRNSAVLNQSFAVLPVAPGTMPSGNTENLSKVDWVRLWTPADLEGSRLNERSRSLSTLAQTQLTRENVFIPLVRATQTRFEQAGYRLWAGEAVVIAKLLTLLLEGSATTTAAIRAMEDRPHWFEQMGRLLLDSPDMVKSVGKMVAEPLFVDLVYDAILTGFALLGSITTEDLGTPAEKSEYAESMVNILNGNGGDSLDVVHVYLPLILGGMTVNQELRMPGEDALDVAELMVNARLAREPERNESNQFVFNLLDKVLDQELARHNTSLQRYLDPVERLRYR
jgi:hypothetical protein